MLLLFQSNQRVQRYGQFRFSIPVDFEPMVGSKIHYLQLPTYGYEIKLAAQGECNGHNYFLIRLSFCLSFAEMVLNSL